MKNRLLPTFLLMFALLFIVPQTVAQTIYKSNVKEESGEYFYNVSTNSMRVLNYEELDEPCTRLKITIFSFDLNSIWKQFTLIAPNGYRFTETPLEISDSNENGFYVHATDDYFNRDNLVEVIMAIRALNSNDYDRSKYVLMNETSQVLLEFPNDCEHSEFHVRTTSGGYIYLDSYSDSGPLYVIDTNANVGINSLKADEHPGSVSPNPSNGAASITIDWGYTLLNAGTLTIVDMDGKLVHSQDIASGKSKTSLSTSRLVPGAYIYVVQSDNGYTTTGKLIIN